MERASTESQVVTKDSTIEFSKIQDQIPGSISKNIAEYLRTKIITHQIPKGYVFPREDHFCKQLGVGRGSLREAYKSLETDGLITRTKRGTYVNDANPVSSFNFFSTEVQMSDTRDLIEFRSMVEAELAGLSAERATKENIARLELLLQSMVDHRNDIRELTYFDMQFHLEVANASGNKLLIKTMYSVADTFAKEIYNAFLIDTENNVNQALEYHKNILFAIKIHNREMARNAMRGHVQSVKDRLIQSSKG